MKFVYLLHVLCYVISSKVPQFEILSDAAIVIHVCSFPQVMRCERVDTHWISVLVVLVDSFSNSMHRPFALHKDITWLSAFYLFVNRYLLHSISLKDQLGYHSRNIHFVPALFLLFFLLLLFNVMFGCALFNLLSFLFLNNLLLFLFWFLVRVWACHVQIVTLVAVPKQKAAFTTRSRETLVGVLPFYFAPRAFFHDLFSRRHHDLRLGPVWRQRHRYVVQISAVRLTLHNLSLHAKARLLLILKHCLH